MIKYAAKWSFKKPDLAKVTIARETEQMVIISDSENILGYQWFGRRTHKSKVNLFDTKDKALSFLLNEASNNIIQLQREIREIGNEMQRLEGIE